MIRAKDRLGCQVWIEPDDPPARIDRLFAAAAETGLGWGRIFLMWPWIEPEPDVWRFDVFDAAFDAAARHGVRVKATLTANSGPWHVGTPSVLHSHTGVLSSAQREPMRRYVHACVGRYRRHPALGQWILWNEPYGGAERTDETLAHWRRWLAEHEGENIARLNRRWGTGYRGFDEIPFPEHVPHELHRASPWRSFGPWLADGPSRAAWLNAELAWVRDAVRELDPETETCLNPTDLLTNQAQRGTDPDGMARLVDVVGASFHPPWQFMFAPRPLFPALIAAGTRLLAALPAAGRVEVTEVQSGNTLNSGHRPSDATPGEVVRFFLAGLAAGAESVTGWCLNVRRRDFEAGDWGLLDDLDRPSARSRALRDLHDRLDRALARTGPWRSAPPRAWVVTDPRSQAVEWTESLMTTPAPGRLADDGSHGAALVAAALMHLGVSTTIARPDALPPTAPAGGLVVLTHLVAWDAPLADRLLAFVGSGGTLLLDATCGRKDADAALHRPWPGGLADRIGLRGAGLKTRPEGHPLTLDGLPAGRWLLARFDAEIDPAAGWAAWSQPRFVLDGEPCVWERRLGRGRVVVVRGPLGPSLTHADGALPAVLRVLGLAAGPETDVAPVAADHAVAVPVAVERGALTAVLAPDALDRGGRPLRLRAPHPDYHDLWTGEAVRRGPDGEIALPAPDGVALLWRPEADGTDRPTTD